MRAGLGPRRPRSDRNAKLEREPVWHERDAELEHDLVRQGRDREIDHRQLERASKHPTQTGAERIKLSRVERR